MPRALFQRPENGNCAKRIPKSGRARSPPAYIKPQEPARPPARQWPPGLGVNGGRAPRQVVLGWHRHRPLPKGLA